MIKVDWKNLEKRLVKDIDDANLLIRKAWEDEQYECLPALYNNRKVCEDLYVSSYLKFGPTYIILRRVKETLEEQGLQN